MIFLCITFYQTALNKYWKELIYPEKSLYLHYATVEKLVMFEMYYDEMRTWNNSNQQNLIKCKNKYTTQVSDVSSLILINYLDIVHSI